MSNINLSVENKKEFNGDFLKSTQSIIIGILVTLIVVYGGLIFLVNMTDKNIAMIGSEYEAEKQKLIGAGNANGEVIDLQKRIFFAKSLVEKKSVPENILTGLEKSMIDGVSLSLLDYLAGGNSISIEGNANNLYDLAKQLLSFKNSSIFSGIEGDVSTKTSENTGIDFTLSLKINNLSS
jgi:hypothetical protein